MGGAAGSAGSGRGPDLGAGLADLSADGTCVRLTAEVTPGDQLAVSLVRDGRAPARVRSRVRWRRALGGGLFAAGLEFDRPLTRTEMADLVR